MLKLQSQLKSLFYGKITKVKNIRDRIIFAFEKLYRTMIIQSIENLRLFI